MVWMPYFRRRVISGSSTGFVEARGWHWSQRCIKGQTEGGLGGAGAESDGSRTIFFVDFLF